MTQPHIAYPFLDREFSAVTEISVADEMNFDGSRQGQKTAKARVGAFSDASPARNSELMQGAA
jgi:hypothetical protein